jgi:PKD repeat protein
MKKAETPRLFRTFLQITGILAVIFLFSCDKEEVQPEPDDAVASFQYAISETNFLEVTFTNYSQNAVSYSWNFDDGNTSTEENPVHVYAEPGNYEVVLTATNSANKNATFSSTIEIKDPDEALALLAGQTSKTWRLYRDDISMGVGGSVDNPYQYWSLLNDGSRPCVYKHEFTFNRDGSYVFDDKGSFWGEGGVLQESLVGTCFEAVAANMVNVDGADVSAWLGGTHAFEYDPATNRVTLTGDGAWIGLPKVATDGEVKVPQNSVAFNISIEEHTGYDLMTVLFDYGDLVWQFVYASYSDPSLEPAVKEEEDPFVDLPNYTPTEMFNTFASTDEADVKYLVPTESAVTITPGVDDPADATAAKVGKYERGTETYADLKFQMDFNIQFDNFTTVSIDVYIPSDNTYADGGLTKGIQLWIADASTTTEFWNSWVQFVVDPADIVTDEWKTYTFQLDTPSEGSTGTALSREDLDLVGLVLGGSGHNVDGTFYIRNFKFE